MTSKLTMATPLFLLVTLVAPAAQVDDPEGYLPLAVGTRWVLKTPSQGASAVFEVLEKDGEGYKVRSTHPWGSSEWTLVRNGGVYTMVAYGQGGPMMPLTKRPQYLDFTKQAGGTWSNQLGKFSLDSRTQTVRTPSETFNNCIQIRHKAGGADLVFVFAKGIGYVQFGEGDNAFVLDRASSTLPGASGSGRISSSARPPNNRPPTGNSATATARSGPRQSGKGNRPYYGLTPNKFAGEPLTLDVMTKRFNQTVQAGVNFIVANGEWAQLEPEKGRYDLSSLNQMISVAAPANLTLSYTLRIVNTIYRSVPKDLERTSWNDPRMRSRLLQLIEVLAPQLKGRTKWFMLGYEVDGYFEKHPGEVQDFIELDRAVTARLKELIPGIQVSTTFTYTGLPSLRGRLAGLNRQLDFIALTYCAQKPGFVVDEPSVLPSDFAKMKEYAAGRKIVFQEIAYPTAPATRGSEDKQAEFFKLAFQEFARDPGAFDAVNFMNLADLSDQDANQYTKFYGLTGHDAFRGMLQTLGMFDKNGRPKKGWDVFRQGIQR
ncbi:hypothetical protein [uncultured Paludibaculum sp.]|uniref:hypothetical protein n=1 Tax=uncultured Paludibaculum sp. TaxID=1765020 RepID=UPI002AAB159F|nr:hypothetical protein [uncultured Paludibaculum sp.]